MQQKILTLLDDLNVDYEYLTHAAAHTMADLADFDAQTNAVYMKNLFLRNANGKKHYLVVVKGDKRVDLKKLAKAIGATRLSFASDERLKKHLNLTQGHVGPFGLVYDTDNNVTTVLDKDIIGLPRISFHPNDNTATVIVSYDGLQRFLKHMGANVVTANIEE